MPVAQKPSTIELPLLKRYVTLAPLEPQGGSIVNMETREAVFTVSSEMPQERINWDVWDYVNEVLLHEENAIDLTRVNTGAAPVLWNHDTNLIRGVVVKGWIEDRKLYCQVRFSTSAEAQQLAVDVNDGIVTNVSIGYRIKEMQLTQLAENGLDTWTATNWEVLEVSLVSVPADPSVGPNRSAETELNKVVLRGNMATQKPVTTPEPEIQERTYSAAEVEALQRELTQARTEREAIERRSQVTDKFHGLRQRAEKLVGELKLSTAAYEEMFGAGEAGQRSVIDSLIQDSGKADQIDFYLSQQEKYAVAPTAFGKSIVGQTELPPPPGERLQQARSPEEIQATAQRLANAAANQRTVI